ncbi:MAG: hypothetical protein K6G69_02415 [Lachnospiraceae bacterium]|nr:hypothetical protein [Lachnospiraceae bacterium]
MKFKQLISTIIVIILSIIVLKKETDITESKASDNKYRAFFEHSQDFDVFFLGTSHVINAVYPMELWHDYGISSYNFGGHANELATTYWVFKNALNYSKPKVVFVDCMLLGDQQKTWDDFSYVHLSLDAFPLSLTKINAINDLLDDKVIVQRISEGSLTVSEKRTKIGLLWDYSVYHPRWSELSEGDFCPTSIKEYGAESRIYISKPGVVVNNPQTVLTEKTTGIEYLIKIIETCDENDIDIVLMNLPFPVNTEKQWQEINTVYTIADKYGVDYINFLDEDVVDFNTDCYDSNSHLNPSGALKVTDYLGKYILSKYKNLSHTGDMNYNYMDTDYADYKSYKDSRFNEVEDLNTYLMLLQDYDYGFMMNIGDTSIFNDTTTLNLLKNKGVNIDELTDDTHYIITYKNEVQLIRENINKNGQYGKFSIFFNAHNEYSVYVDNTELFTTDSNTLSQQPNAISICVFDLDNGSGLVDTSSFKTQAFTE